MLFFNTNFETMSYYNTDSEITCNFFFEVVGVAPLYVSFLRSTLKKHIKVWPEEADLSIAESTEIIQMLAKLILTVESPDFQKINLTLTCDDIVGIFINVNLLY